MELNRVSSLLAQLPAATQRIFRLYPLLAAVAASLLLVASGQRKRFLLPDSTVVYLNAGSRLTYPAGFSDTASVAWL